MPEQGPAAAPAQGTWQEPRCFEALLELAPNKVILDLTNPMDWIRIG